MLHRIVAIHGGHYTFKGDNNSFLDPVHPTRSQLIGKLWLHLPRAGVMLKWLHDARSSTACYAGCSGLFLLFGVGEKERAPASPPPRGIADPLATDIHS